MSARPPLSTNIGFQSDKVDRGHDEQLAGQRGGGQHRQRGGRAGLGEDGAGAGARGRPPSLCHPGRVRQEEAADGAVLRLA